MFETSTRHPDLHAGHGHMDQSVSAVHPLQRVFPFLDPENSTQTFPMNNFDALVSALRDRLGPCSGINDDDVDPEELQSLMRGYMSKELEWEKYAFRVPSKLYTRNLVDKGNGKCNLVGLAFSHACVAYL